jgi:hypothetical protein
MSIRPWALSQYPRCPAPGTKPEDYYKSNKCEFVERSKIPVMGYSLRTDQWRMTLWTTWVGTTLKPDWDKLIGTELYAHEAGFADGDGAGTACDTMVNGCFDGFENSNEADANPQVVKELTAQLKRIVAAE